MQAQSLSKAYLKNRPGHMPDLLHPETRRPAAAQLTMTAQVYTERMRKTERASVNAAKGNKCAEPEDLS